MRSFSAIATIASLVVGVFAIAFPVSGAIESYTYEFTAADLLTPQYVHGEDGSTAADNQLFDGARLLRVGRSGTAGDAGRTYVESQQDEFDDRFNSYTDNGYVLDAFNVWGLDGNGAKWGEDYKPLEWVEHSGPDGWSTGFHDAGPDGLGWYQNTDNTLSNYLDYHTSLFPWWAAGQDDAIPLDATEDELEDYEFSVTIKFDTTDAFWGQETNNAPNSLGIGDDLTLWFGGWVSQYDENGDIVDEHMYEGNMVQAAVPEPATTAIWSLLALAGMGLISWRRRRQASA